MNRQDNQYDASMKRVLLIGMLIASTTQQMFSQERNRTLFPVYRSIECNLMARHHLNFSRCVDPIRVIISFGTSTSPAIFGQVWTESITSSRIRFAFLMPNWPAGAIKSALVKPSLFPFSVI